MTAFEFDGACMVGLMCVMLVCVYVYDGTCGYWYMLVHVCVRTCICEYRCACVHVYVDTCTCTCWYRYMLVYVRTCIFLNFLYKQDEINPNIFPMPFNLTLYFHNIISEHNSTIPLL